MRLNTFDEVASWYNKTAPIRGARKAWDLRPLWDRKRWWERIIKIDDNTYALSDGNSAYSTRGEATEEKLAEVNREALLVAPIVWLRRKDGDYVRLRGCTNHGGAISRYKFLEMYLPNGVSHCANNSGVHWIQAANQRYLLPIFKHKWGTGTNEEDKYLEFKLDGGKFLLTSERYKKTVPIVNRDLTKHYNPKIKELWEYARMILPVFGDTLMAQQGAKLDIIMNKYLGVSAWDWARRIDKSAIRELLDNPETLAEERLAFCVITAIHLDMYETIYAKKDLGNGRTYSAVLGGRFKEDKNSYTRFKNFMHRVGGMKTTKQVDFE